MSREIYFKLLKGVHKYVIYRNIVFIKGISPYEPYLIYILTAIFLVGHKTPTYIRLEIYIEQDDFVEAQSN